MSGESGLRMGDDGDPKTTYRRSGNLKIALWSTELGADDIPQEAWRLTGHYGA